MKRKARFTPADAGGIFVEMSGESRVVRDLDDLRLILEAYEDVDAESLAKFGRVAVLLAVRGLQRAGTEPTRSSIARTLDAHYLVLANQRSNEALQRGLDDGINAAVTTGALSEEELWKGIR